MHDIMHDISATDVRDFHCHLRICRVAACISVNATLLQIALGICDSSCGTGRATPEEERRGRYS
jgi:hypothetical protein